MKSVVCAIAYILQVVLYPILWIAEPDRARFYTAEWWIKRAYRKRKWARAADLSYNYLAQAERFHSDWNYGNAFHNGHQFLGLIGLRQGDVVAARKHLLLAGFTPGSPQLDSFGPTMTLARELLERGERLIVVEYIDLIARFWTEDKPSHANLPGHREDLEEKKRLIREWKEQIANGVIPKYYLWHQTV